MAVGIILVFVGSAIMPSIARNSEKPSLPTSSDHWLYVGGSGPGNYTRIQDAIDNATDGDTVFVFNGIYYENDRVDKSISIIGENKDRILVFGDGITPCFNITANKVNISGFTIRNDYGTGIALDSSACTIRHNIFDNNTVGIWASNESSNNLVYENNFLKRNPSNTTHHAIDYGSNTWDNGYRFGGNYWDDYSGNDSYQGPNQDIPGSDGKGDTPYVIYGGTNQDNYPFMSYDGWLNPSLKSDFVFVYSLPRGRIEFFDNSTAINGHIVNWYWEFGDGDSSGEQNPIHQYTPDDQTYLVSLTVTDEFGSTDTIAKKVRIGIIPEAGGPYRGHVNEAVVFDGSESYDPYGTIVSYEWDFGDDSTGSGVHPTHKYTSSGVFKVFLTVTNNSGSNGVDFTVANIDSNIWYVGGSGPGNYTTIESAVEASSDGDTVYVYSGIYGAYQSVDNAIVLIDRRIALVGEDKYTTIIDASLDLAIEGIRANVGGIIISGFTIKNAVSADGRGISIDASKPYISDITIYDNILEHNDYGISDFDGVNCKIYHNIVLHNNIAGIWLATGKNCDVTNNVIVDNPIGVYVTSSQSNIIENNQIKENEKGIYITTNTPSTIRFNNFINNTLHASFVKGDLLINYILHPLTLFAKQKWRYNYWDDWKTHTPKPIRGVCIIASYLFFYQFTFISIQYDWHPAQEPYDIPRMS